MRVSPGRRQPFSLSDNLEGAGRLCFHWPQERGRVCEWDTHPGPERPGKPLIHHTGQPLHRRADPQRPSPHATSRLPPVRPYTRLRDMDVPQRPLNTRRLALPTLWTLSAPGLRWKAAGPAGCSGAVDLCSCRGALLSGALRLALCWFLPNSRSAATAPHSPDHCLQGTAPSPCRSFSLEAGSRTLGHALRLASSSSQSGRGSQVAGAARPACSRSFLKRGLGAEGSAAYLDLLMERAIAVLLQTCSPRQALSEPRSWFPAGNCTIAFPPGRRSLASTWRWGPLARKTECLHPRRHRQLPELRELRGTLPQTPQSRCVGQLEEAAHCYQCVHEMAEGQSLL